MEELRHRVEKVDDLGQQENEQSFGKVAQDADHGENHAAEIAVGVAHEHLRRVPVVLPQASGHAQEGNDEDGRKQVRVVGRRRQRRKQVAQVVEQEDHTQHDGLAHLEPVDAGQDVDGVWRKNRQRRHVGVVAHAQVEQLRRLLGRNVVGGQRGEAEARDGRHGPVDGVDQDAQHVDGRVAARHTRHKRRHDDGRDAEVDVVDYEQRQRRHCGQEKLVAPADVKQVVKEAQKHGAEQTQGAAQELGQLVVREHVVVVLHRMVLVLVHGQDVAVVGKRLERDKVLEKHKRDDRHEQHHVRDRGHNAHGLGNGRHGRFFRQVPAQKTHAEKTGAETRNQVRSGRKANETKRHGRLERAVGASKRQCGY